MWHCMVIPKHMKLGALASGMQKKEEKKTYFTSSNTTLFILPFHFTTHPTSQFLFLHTTH